MKNQLIQRTICILSIGLCLATAVSAQVFGWGYDNDGELGLGHFGDLHSTPTNLNLTNKTAVCGGVYHSLFLNADGTVATAGGNDYGQIGDGTLVRKNTLTPVSGITNAKAVACGNYHSLVLLQNGTVLSWGWNPAGPLGDGTQTTRTTPVAVSGLTNVIAISAGYRHSLALKADGTVWAWGENFNGQLGIGFISFFSLVPVQIPTLSNVISVASGTSVSYFLKSDGTVWFSGNNSSGLFGNGLLTPVNILTPTQIPMLSNVTQISSRTIHAVALKQDGTVWTWGNTANGELGNNVFTSPTLSPTQSTTFNDVIEIGTGYYHTIVRRRNGEIWGWGYNGVSDLGIGFQSNSGCACQPLPVQNLSGTGNALLAVGNDHGFAMKPQITTPIGSNISSQGSNVRLTFSNVTAAGTTTYTAIDPTATGLTVPPNYVIRPNAAAYNITTTTGDIDVCVTTQNEYSQTIFNRLTILHGEGANLVDRTISRDLYKREVCGRVTSLSPFVIADNLTPTAADVSVSGRITTANGRGIRNAMVTLTDGNGNARSTLTGTFGYYRFEEVQAGETYIVAVRSRRYQFAPQIVSLTDAIEGLDFMAIP